MTTEPDMTVMGISGELLVLKAEDKLIVQIPDSTVEYMHAVARHVEDRFGYRALVMGGAALLTVVAPGQKVIIRTSGLTEEMFAVWKDRLGKVFGEDGFIIISADMTEIEVEPRPEG